jgi:ubiquinol-cytochrome c reductase cytochrome b subunit
MMLSYAPSSLTAWSSVFYINQEMWMGWFIRGVHHFSAQALMVLLPLHLLQVVLARAYRRPREFVWWFGLALMFLAAAFSLTGYLLPWDQKGYWHARVATNIMGSAPIVGPYILKVLIGGTDYGNQTVTHFYGLHVGVLPLLFVLFTTAHIALFRRYGVTPPLGADNRLSVSYWPDQAVRNALFCAGMLGVVITLTLIEGGTTLDAPADPSSSDYPARPEWYFLSLFQMLKLFPGKREVIGTFVIPVSLALALLLLPFLDRLLPAKLAHFLACIFVLTLFSGVSFLTVKALRTDANDPLFQAARQKADLARDRAIELAGSTEVGIPPEGSAYILRRDPLTQGRIVLEKKCLGCHFFDGKGSGEQTAADLTRFGTRDWVRGLLENPGAAAYFGKVPQCDGMAEWKRGSKLSSKQLDDVADFVGSFADIPADVTVDEWLNTPKVSNHPGLTPFQNECGTCHAIDGFTDGGARDAPKLFAWGSPQWIARMIRKPGADDNYGYLKAKDQMPPFGSDQLIQNDVEMMTRYLKDDYLKPGAAAKGR